jgi:hypothetical protein
MVTVKDVFGSLLATVYTTDGKVFDVDASQAQDRYELEWSHAIVRCVADALEELALPGHYCIDILGESGCRHFAIQIPGGVLEDCD